MADSVQQMRAEVNNAIDGRLDTLNSLTIAMYALRRVPSTLHSPTTSATWLRKAEIHATRERTRGNKMQVQVESFYTVDGTTLSMDCAEAVLRITEAQQFRVQRSERTF